jgi:cytochrome P450
MRRPAAVPAYEPDLYSAGDPRPAPALRAPAPTGAGGVAEQAAGLRLAALCRVQAVLRDDMTFVSGEGVGLNGVFNRLSRGTTLNSDGYQHDQRRKLVAHPLLPRALRTMSDTVNRQAEQLVAAAVRRQRLDGVNDLATALPLSVVPDLVGWPEDRHQHLLRWGGATFDVLGPLNRNALKSVRASLQMLRFSKDVGAPPLCDGRQHGS